MAFIAVLSGYDKVPAVCGDGRVSETRERRERVGFRRHQAKEKAPKHRLLSNQLQLLMRDVTRLCGTGDADDILVKTKDVYRQRSTMLSKSLDVSLATIIVGSDEGTSMMSVLAD